MGRYRWLTLLGVILFVIGVIELFAGHSSGWQRVGLGLAIALGGIALGKQSS
ncbi:MAG: hypothetical protein ACK8QZ_04340 [Anaerolineales bacterium]